MIYMNKTVIFLFILLLLNLSASAEANDNPYHSIYNTSNVVNLPAVPVLPDVIQPETFIKEITPPAKKSVNKRKEPRLSTLEELRQLKSEMYKTKTEIKKEIIEFKKSFN